MKIYLTNKNWSQEAMISFTPKPSKNRTKLRTWAPVNGLHPLERYIAHYVTYKDYAPLGWVVGGPELPRYASV